VERETAQYERPNRDVVQVGRDAAPRAGTGSGIARLYRFRAAAPAKCWIARLRAWSI
jgi:hypothetical protein